MSRRNDEAEYKGKDVCFLGKRESSKQETKKLQKKLEKSGEFLILDGTIQDSSGNFVPAFANWTEHVALFDQGICFERFAILEVYYHTEVFRYKVQSSELDAIKKKKTLPELQGLRFNQTERGILYKTTRTLQTHKAKVEKKLNYKQPEKQEVAHFREGTKELSYDLTIVAEALRSPFILSTVAECLLTNCRPWIKGESLPSYVTVFVADINGARAIYQLLNACNFTSNRLLTLEVSTMADIKNWRSYGCRMTVVTAQETAKKVFLGQSTKLWMDDGSVEPFPGKVFMKSTKKLTDSNAYQITTPTNLPEFSSELLDGIRAFMGELVSQPKCLASRLVSDYWEIENSATGYRILPWEIWQQVSEKVVQEALTEFNSVVKEAQEARIAAENLAELQLQEAETFLRNPNLYLDNVTAVWPKTQADILALLDETQEYCSLYKHAKTGDRFLVFTANSLLRLCKGAGLPSEASDIFLDRLDSSGLIDKWGTTTKLADGSTMRLVRLYAKDCISYAVTEVTDEKGENL